MCGDVSRWAVPSVSLCACRVCEWSVCLQNIYISRFSLRLALLSQIRIHDTHKEATACPHRSPLTRKEAAAWPACPHRSALTRSHTADTSRISSLGLAPPGAPMRRPAIFAVLPFCLPRPHAHPTFLPMPQDGDEAIPTTRPHSICWQKAASTSSPKCCAMMLPRPLSKVLFELWRTTETPERWYAPMCWPWMPYACSERPAWQ